MAFTYHRQRRVLGCVQQFNLRLETRGFGQLRLKSRRVDDPGQRRHAMLRGPEIHHAGTGLLDLHRQNRRGVRRVRPAAQARQQFSGPCVKRISPHIGAGTHVGGRGRHQANPQTLARQQQRQRVADNAATANTHIQGSCHLRDCRRRCKIAIVTMASPPPPGQLYLE